MALYTGFCCCFLYTRALDVRRGGTIIDLSQFYCKILRVMAHYQEKCRFYHLSHGMFQMPSFVGASTWFSTCIFNVFRILKNSTNKNTHCFRYISCYLPQAYAAGCNIVILASTFERVQIIPGATHNYIRISALDCSTDTGKIAAAYEDKVCIFEPTPLIHSQSSPAHGLEYR